MRCSCDRLWAQVASDTASIRLECAQAAGALARDVEALNGDLQALQLAGRHTASARCAAPLLGWWSRFCSTQPVHRKGAATC